MKQNKIDFMDMTTGMVIEIDAVDNTAAMKAYAEQFAKKEEKNNDGVQ